MNSASYNFSEDSDLFETEESHLLTRSDIKSTRNDESEQSIFRSLFAEFLSSLFYIYLSLTALFISTALGKLGQILFLVIGSSCYGVLLYSFSFPISSKKISVSEIRHINCVISLSLFFSRHISFIRFVLNAVFQFCGGLISILFIYLSVTKIPNNVIYFTSKSDSLWMFFVLQSLCTFIFSFVQLKLVFGKFFYTEQDFSHLKEHSPQSQHELNALTSAILLLIMSGIGTYCNPIADSILVILLKGKGSELLAASWLGGLLGSFLASVFDKIF